ncbi:hypothetical protein V5R04_02525 [Jonesiaceae bacterium BS-20]|uniref:Uncharacterized protein n=1 Tax=Jonesiaceae bacterium BS-20 TaxID=3120821 RepID=A0AAU7DXV3_9MICO
MDLRATHHLPGDSVPAAGVTIPRWIEIKDRRDQPQATSAQRSSFYVVSPECTLDDARIFAHLYGQRDRMERTYQLLSKTQTSFVLATVIGVILIVMSQASAWWFLVPAGLIAGHQAILRDAATEIIKPFNAATIAEITKSPMLLSVSKAEYLVVSRFAAKYPKRASEVHRMMWRVRALEKLYGDAEQAVGKLNKRSGVSPAGLVQTRARLAALHKLIHDARTSLHALVNPPRVVNPLQRGNLLELVHEINSVLRLGLDDLVPRIDSQTQQLHERILPDQPDEQTPKLP